MPIAHDRLFEIAAELARRPGHEAVRTHVCALLTEGLGAELRDIAHETRVVEAKGRIDALLGRTILEFKSNLSRERADAVEELSRYLPEREKATGERFIGIATDGADWEVFELRAGAPFSLRTFKTDPRKPDDLLAWLDGAVATRAEIPPDALNVVRELGQSSVAFLRAKAVLAEAWSAVKDHPTASLHRQLWSQLLTLVYGRRVEDDELWLQHTFLVIVAKAIAARIMEVEADDPEAILSGRVFSDAGILGAVESDFFDWILVAPQGPDLVRRLARHVGRFKLREVKTDVLKVLYESLIDRDQRHGLGEYYTPDWLAAKMVGKAVTSPLEQTVLDPACGSGTFLFHAVRRVMEEAKDAGLEPEDWAAEATRLVAGMDIHPVAVIIARVTYLLALAPAIAARAGAVSVPVYLGDALQLSVQQYMRRQELVIVVPPAPGEEAKALTNGGATGGAVTNGAAMLVFPEQLAKDGPLFDKLIEDVRLASLGADSAEQFRRRAVRTIEQHYKRDLIGEENAALDDLCKTYVTFDALRRAGRDTIWGYVARNLTRPFTFAAGVRWASVMVGNPPWLAFRHMTGELQARFRELARGERIHVGGKMATQNDLCALFTVRAAGLYLRAAGTIAFVLPRAVMRGGQFAPLRTGSFESLRIAWDEAWDLDEVEPLFPVPACVLFGRRRAVGRRTPEKMRRYSGRLPMRDASETIADEKLTVSESDAPPPARIDAGQRPSEFQKMFRQGATLVPRMLCLVERKSRGRLGASTAAPLVASRRTSQEKRPWKDLPGIEHPVEREFLRPVYLGESILPFRVWRLFEGVVPVDDKGNMLSAKLAADQGWSGLSGWMRAAEATWTGHSRDVMSLGERWNFHNELGAQFPINPMRLLYAASGVNPAATIAMDDNAIVEHGLYWGAIETEEQGRYLVAILNSEEARSRIASLQARGLFGARHFDKVMFTLPIPRFDERNPLHGDLAAAAREAESLAASFEIAEATPFARARRIVRDGLRAAGVSDVIDSLVTRLLDR
ncbi:MAG TPA: N-6 DNA methylase [Caulobacteraceae bacterium]